MPLSLFMITVLRANKRASILQRHKDRNDRKQYSQLSLIAKNPVKAALILTTVGAGLNGYCRSIFSDAKNYHRDSSPGPYNVFARKENNPENDVSKHMFGKVQFSDWQKILASNVSDAAKL